MSSKFTWGVGDLQRVPLRNWTWQETNERAKRALAPFYNFAGEVSGSAHTLSKAEARLFEKMQEAMAICDLLTGPQIPGNHRSPGALFFHLLRAIINGDFVSDPATERETDLRIACEVVYNNLRKEDRERYEAEGIQYPADHIVTE
jgi:hypothetical protein